MRLRRRVVATAPTTESMEIHPVVMELVVTIMAGVEEAAADAATITVSEAHPVDMGPLLRGPGSWSMTIPSARTASKVGCSGPRRS